MCAAFQWEEMCCLWPRSVELSYRDFSDKELAPERRNREDGQVCDMDVQVCMDVGVCKVCMCVSVSMCIRGPENRLRCHPSDLTYFFFVRQSLCLDLYQNASDPVSISLVLGLQAHTRMLSLFKT